MNRKDALIKELTDTLSSLLSQYEEVVHMYTPQHDPEKERTVREARRLVKRDVPDAVSEEFTLLRRLALKTELLLSALPDDLPEEAISRKEKIEEMIGDHIALKKQQGIKRIYD